MEQRLLRELSHELWQSEAAAAHRCRHESERLGAAPPALAMLIAAQHADSVLEALPKLAFERPHPQSALGTLLGKAVSEVRATIADKLFTSERSYRAALLRLRHGIDLVHMMREAAVRTKDEPLIVFFDGWMARRQRMIEEVERQLSWFAARPEQALQPARGFFFAWHTHSDKATRGVYAPVRVRGSSNDVPPPSAER